MTVRFGLSDEVPSLRREQTKDGTLCLSVQTPITEEAHGLKTASIPPA